MEPITTADKLFFYFSILWSNWEFTPASISLTDSMRRWFGPIQSSMIKLRSSFCRQSQEGPVHFYNIPSGGAIFNSGSYFGLSFPQEEPEMYNINTNQMLVLFLPFHNRSENLLWNWPLFSRKHIGSKDKFRMIISKPLIPIAKRKWYNLTWVMKSRVEWLSKCSEKHASKCSELSKSEMKIFLSITLTSFYTNNHSNSPWKSCLQYEVMTRLKMTLNAKSFPTPSLKT